MGGGWGWSGGGQGGCERNVGGRGDVGYGGCEPRIEGRVFPDAGFRVPDSQNAVWDSLTKTWGVP